MLTIGKIMASIVTMVFALVFFWPLGFVLMIAMPFIIKKILEKDRLKNTTKEPKP